MTKISVAWLGLLAILGIILFFSWQIASVAATKGALASSLRGAEGGVGHEAPPEGTLKKVRFANEQALPTESVELASPRDDREGSVVPSKVPNSIPPVPGQTAKDLTLDEPLPATPPATYYDPPDATDPMNGVAFQDAEFGSNLRHPEQMIERRPKPSMNGAVRAGIAAPRSSPGGNNAQGYSTEMVQNGASFMGSVLAFDGSEVGPSYSLI
jgi:hypothetical protein